MTCVKHLVEEGIRLRRENTILSHTNDVYLWQLLTASALYYDCKSNEECAEVLRYLAGPIDEFVEKYKDIPQYGTILKRVYDDAKKTIKNSVR